MNLSQQTHDPVYFLLVDDLEENLLSLEALLRREGLELLKARTGQEALELLLKHEVALALLDVQMPVMDGFELAELMRGMERTRRVPIIFLTAGSADWQRRFRGYEAGAVDFLQKPIEPDILRSKASVFYELYLQRRQIAHQRDRLEQSAEENARLLEESRQHARALREADQRKDEFLATMSHEIRTPMNAIVGLANVLSLSEPLSQKQRDYIRTLQASADSLLLLINDLLDISKIEAQTVDLEQVPLSMETLLQDVVGMIDLPIKEKGLQLLTDTSCIGGRMHMADPTRLRQIILNLCSNAVKFTEKGTISIRLGCEPTEDDNLEEISIIVSDSGIGIPADKLGKIFDKFVQADSSITRKFGGTGLGLAIAKRLAEIMGGDIRVESRVGVGSTFTATVLLRRASETMTSLAAESETAVSVEVEAEEERQKILLVEDYEPNIIVASAFLETLGYAYEVARNGCEAIEKVKAGTFNAVLMDVQMPDMNGFEATRKIRDFERDENRQSLHVIGLTAHAMSGDRERCLSAGMDDYLSKPFDPMTLKEKLDKLSLHADH